MCGSNTVSFKVSVQKVFVQVSDANALFVVPRNT